MKIRLVVPCGQTDGETDMKKPVVDFRDFAKAPKKQVENSRIPIQILG
jgi:hypothetical protein